MTEIIVHMLMPVDTVVETSSLHTMGHQFVSLQFKKAAKILTAEENTYSDNQNDDGVHSHLVCHRLVQQRRQSSRGQHHCGREVAL